MKRFQALVAAGALLALAPARCLAQACAASTTATLFGTYQPASGLAATTVGAVTVTCTSGVLPLTVSYTIQLGTGASGSFTSRSMSNGVGHLQYQLYRDPAYTQVWGDGTAGTYTVSNSELLILSPQSHSFTAYARAPAGQNASIGAYLDTIMVLVTY